MPTMPCPRCWQRQVPCELCGGERRIADQALSPHFALSELLASPTALRAGTANDPPPTVVENLRESALMLWEPVRALLGVPLHVSSGYRSPALNAAVSGSSTTSAHVQGYAIDCEPVGMGLDDAMRRIVRSGLDFDQVIYEFGRWLHLGWRGPNRRQARQTLMIFEPRKYLAWNPADPRTGESA